jgi:hypothetical protein
MDWRSQKRNPHRVSEAIAKEAEDELLGKLRDVVATRTKNGFFGILLCGPSGPEQPETIFKQRLAERLKGQGFDVRFGEDASLEHFRAEAATNALDWEIQYFEKVCNALIIVCGSAGTFSELGAFALISRSDDNRKKLVVLVLHEDHEGDDSFVNAGPRSAINGIGGMILQTSFLGEETINKTIESISKRLNDARAISV